jgi:hypothetical protein
MFLVKHKNSKNVCGLLYYVYRPVLSTRRYIEQTPDPPSFFADPTQLKRLVWIRIKCEI